MIYRTLNIIYQRIFILIFVFCILIVCFSIYIVHANAIIFIQIDEFNNIETKLINIDTNKYSININYPSTKNKTVNQEINNFINYYIKKTEEDTKYFFPNTYNDKFNLNINYECHRINKDIISFIFLIKYSNNSALNSINITTLSYNLKNGKEINLNSFFKENSNYIVTLCNMSKKYLICSNTLDNKVLQFFIDDISYIGGKSFDGYSFSPNYISIYFNTNKISYEYNLIYEVKIPWKSVSDLLKNNVYLLEE
ncbi:MAG: hypothetical protein PHT02_08590 [Tissierellia bacterium]|nr:hypothetical protein [Tissierellia bacterium]